MVLNVSLDHLQEHEIQLILAVLERDAEIQSREEVRKRRLQRSIRGERIPKKRLSVKCRTGEWMSELGDPNRVPKEKGAEVVRASIRRKSLSKPHRVAPVPGVRKEASTERVEVTTEERSTADGQVSVTATESIERTTGTTAENKSVFYPTPTYTDAIARSEEADKPKFRKTSIRKKKVQASGEKQVKFAPEKTEKYVYEPTKVDHIPATDKATQNIPTIIVDDSSGDTIYKHETENVVPEAVPEKVQEEQPKAEHVSYDDNIFSSNKGFESYHSSVGKEIFREGEKPAEAEVKVVEEKKEDTTAYAPKVTKKVKIVKRKGSSRRKASPKFTDDGSRNEFFAGDSSTGVADEKESNAVYEKQEETATEAYHKVEEEMKKDNLYLDDESKAVTDSYNNKADSPTIVAVEYKPTESNIDKVGEVYVTAERTPSTVECEEPYLHGKTEEVIKVEGADLRIVGNTESVVSSAITGYAAGNVSISTGVDSSPQYSTEVPETPKSDDMKYEEKPAEYTPITEAPVSIGVNYDVDVTKVVVASIDKSVDELVSCADEGLKEISTPAYEEPLDEGEILPAGYVQPKESSEYVEPATVVLESPDKKVVCEEEADETSTTEKPKKKVVKRVVKKKTKPTEDEEDTQPIPESAPTGEDETMSENKSKLHRKQTVRKKVIRRKPPPQTN